MRMDKIIAGMILVAAGIALLAGSTASVFDYEEKVDFTDNYPDNDIWSDDGTLSSLTTDTEGDLKLSDGSTQGTGQFVSDIRTLSGDGEIFKIITNSSNTQKDKRNINLTLRAYGEENSVIKQKEYELDNIRETQDIIEFENTTVESYDFVADFGTDGSGTPELHAVEIKGTYTDRADTGFGGSSIVGIFALIAGIMVMFS